MEPMKKRTDWICQLCGQPLLLWEGEKTLGCENGHSYDRARQGYCHLLPVNRKHTRDPGDNAQMVMARREFLHTGGYDGFRQALSRLVLEAVGEKKEPLVLDVGGGEGFYTTHMEQILRGAGKSPRVLGFDISKSAVKAAAGTYKNVSFCVASSFAIPVEEGACDCVTEVFSPLVPEEFRRVTKSGGVQILAVPGPRHLWGMKQVLYGRPYENERHDTDFAGFRFERRETVTGHLSLSRPQDIRNLYAMTPYYWKTGEEGSRRLLALSHLETETEFDFLLYRREEEPSC